MKFIIASDIHGDLNSANTLISVFNSEHADKLILLGDILYHGPRNDLPSTYNPKEVIKLLNAYKANIISVQGNCDAEVDQMVLDFDIMRKHRYVEADGLRFFVTHGHEFNDTTPPALSQGEILIHGHTHIPKCIKFGNDNYCLNPGSISVPKNGFKPSFMLYENRTFTIKTFDGDIIFKETI